MSTYKNLIGKDINYLTTDPDNVQAEGQIWYNSTSGEFKDIIISQAWSSGGPVSNARRGGAASGTLTAGLAFGGRIPPGTNVADTEEYNGTGWAAGGNLGTARYNLASATNAPQTASLAFGSATSPDTTTEEYNGSSWTAGGALNTGRGFLGGAGIQTAALGFGGYAGGNVNNVEEYDGSSWTAANVFPSSTRQMGGNGLQTAALSTGGTTTGPSISTTVEYDGTNWTSGGAYPQAIIDVRLAGIQTDTLAFGGSPPPSKTTLTTNYDGTSWTVNPASMATPRTAHFGGGTSSAAFAASGLTGGPPPSSTPFSEEYNRSVNVITSAAWASGGTMNTTKRYMAGLGTRPAALAAGGSTSSPGLNETANSEEYDGSSWSEGNNLGTARIGLGGAGSQTSSIAAGGRTPSDKDAVNSEEYNGTSWTSTPNLNTGRRYVAGFGASETAAVVAGGTVGGAPGAGTKQSATEEYNGSSWTAGGSMNTAKTSTDGNSVGTETAGLYITGNAGVEEYNGTAWSEQNDLNRSAPGNGGGACGVQTAALFAGGPSVSGSTESYDGTSFITTASLGTGRNYSGGAGATSATGTIFGGFIGPSSPKTTGATEEFTGETTALNIKTITTS